MRPSFARSPNFIVRYYSLSDPSGVRECVQNRPVYIQTQEAKQPSLVLHSHQPSVDTHLSLSTLGSSCTRPYSRIQCGAAPSLNIFVQLLPKHASVRGPRQFASHVLHDAESPPSLTDSTQTIGDCTRRIPPLSIYG